MDPETQAMMNLLMAQGGMDPFLMSQLFGIVPPEMDSSGEPQPWDATNQAKGLNLTQDYFTSMADMVPAMLGGAGSFGQAPFGGGMAGGGGLRPIRTETILETPQLQTLQVMARNPTTLEGFIANGLLGGNPASVIYADLKSKIEDPEGNGVDPKIMQNIAAGLPQTPELDPLGKPTDRMLPDWVATRKMIDNDYALPYMKEQGTLSGPNVQPNALGQFVSIGEKPSKAMEWLSERGYSSPTDQYDVNYALQNDPEMAGMLEQIVARGQAYDEAKTAYSKYLAKQPMANRIDAMLQRRQSGREQDYQDDLLKYFDRYRTETQDRGRGEGPALPTQPGEAGPRRVMYANAVGMLGPPVQPGDQGPQAVANEFGQPQRVEPLPKLSAAQPGPMGKPNMFERAMARAIGGFSNATEDKMRFAAQRQNSMMGKDIADFARMLRPTYQAQRSGRTPFGDQVAQRMSVVNMLMGR